MESLRARLSSRGTDDEAVIERRMREAHLQLSECGHFDHLVVNDRLESAHDQFQAVLVAELTRSRRHPALIARFTD